MLSTATFIEEPPSFFIPGVADARIRFHGDAFLGQRVSVHYTIGHRLHNTTNPNEHEVGYFEQIENSSASEMTIKQVLSEPNGLAKLKKEYRQIYVIAIGFVVLSVVLWGYLFINLGL